jgi:hypothetical protein
MTTAVATSKTARRPWPRSVRLAGWTTLAVLGAGVIGYLGTATLGAVTGTEFCPQTFERRSYTYYELPFIHVQIKGEKHKDVSAATEVFLTSKKYVTQKTGGKQDWHLIHGLRGGNWRTGSAELLMNYLDAKNAEDYHRWVKWSEDHPELATEFWPAVQTLAEQSRYIDMPDLFDLTKTHDDATKLKQAIDSVLTTKSAAN